MAAVAISVTPLNDPDHIARYCGSKKHNPDGSPSPAAFLLSDSDLKPDPNLADPRPFLSTNWLEFFHKHDRGVQIKGVIDSLKAKTRGIGPTAKFAVFNVLDAKTQCEAEGFQIEIKTTGEIDDLSHTGIYGYEHANGDVAAILAVQVKHSLFPTTQQRST